MGKNLLAFQLIYTMPQLTQMPKTCNNTSVTSDTLINHNQYKIHRSAQVLKAENILWNLLLSITSQENSWSLLHCLLKSSKQDLPLIKAPWKIATTSHEPEKYHWENEFCVRFSVAKQTYWKAESKPWVPVTTSCSSNNKSGQDLQL